MKAIVDGFVDLVGYLELAKFEDPDEAEGAEETVSRCLAEASEAERALLVNSAVRKTRESRSKGHDETAEFFDRFAARIRAVS